MFYNTRMFGMPLKLRLMKCVKIFDIIVYDCKKSVIKMRYTHIRLGSYICIYYDVIFIKILVVHSKYWLIY